MKRHFLLKPRVLLEEGMLGLFVLEKAKGAWGVVEVLRFERSEEGGAEAEETFAKRAEDCFEINRRAYAVKRALEEVETAGEVGGKAAKAAALRRVLEKKVALLLPEDDALLATRAGPYEKRARARIAELEAGGGE